MTETNDRKPAFARLVRLVTERGLPDVTQSAVDGAPALVTGDTPFAIIHDPVTLILACPRHQKVLLMDISPDLYFETEQHVGRDTMLIDLGRIADEELSLRLHDAWEYVAPDRLKRDVD